MEPVAPKSRHRLRRFFGATALLAAGAIAAIVVANLFDRDLAPEASGYFRSGIPPPFARDTGWALIVGFAAPAGEDPREYGERRWRDSKRAADEHRQAASSPRELAIRAPDELLCSPEADDCARRFQVRPQAIADLAADNSVLMSRYDELLRADRLGETGAEAAFFADGIDRLIESPRKTGEMMEATPFFAHLAGLTIRRNATFDRAYPLFRAWERLDAVESHLLGPAIERVGAEVRQGAAVDLTAAYNFAGRKIIEETAPWAGSYFFRVRDLDALASLVRCAAAIRAGGIAPESAAGHIARSGGDCLDPLTGRPLAWDESTRRLWFKPGGPSNVARMGGAEGRVALSPY